MTKMLKKVAQIVQLEAKTIMREIWKSAAQKVLHGARPVMTEI